MQNSIRRRPQHATSFAAKLPRWAFRFAGIGALWTLVVLALARESSAQACRDNETLYSNQDPNTETRRSDHFRLSFGHSNRDTGTPMTEQLVQGNLQMYEQMWHRWVIELGLHDINESVTKPDGNKYRANFNFLMTWNDGGGGGAYSSMDANGFFYAMANSGYCRFDPPSGATPHEFGHVWEGSCGGFNGSDSSGAWWECTANWMQLQFLNSYPQAGGYIQNGMYYPAHGRDYYDSWVIWEAARDDSRYGAAWVNNVWTNYNADQQAHEYIVDRMVRCDSSGSADKAGALKDLWGDMAKKMVTWDFDRKQWLAQANSSDDGSNWYFYQRCRTPLVKMPGGTAWYRPERSHTPMEFGFNIIPLAASAGTTVTSNFQPQGDPVRQSDWRACLVAVNASGDASYSALWNIGPNSLALSADQSKLYLVVIAVPKPMKIADPAWQAYLTDAGLQFPYAVSFSNAIPKNVIYPVQSRAGMTQHPNGGGWKANTATVDATVYVGPNAQVLNSAQVRGYARIEDYAVVKDSAQVGSNAVVSGHALVEASAKVYGNAKIGDWGHVFGYAEIYENGKVLEHGNCGDGSAATHTKVYGNAVVKGTTYVYDTSTFAGCLMMEGDSANGNGTTAADHGVHFGWGWGQDTARYAALPDNGYIYAQHTFEKDNPVFALDQYGINHGFLMNGCRATVEPTRGGRVLSLDGVSQYVELHNSLNDFREMALGLWVKWTGSGSDQRIWSFGDGASKVMYLTPQDAATGKLRFVISDGITTQTLDGTAAVPSYTWTHLAVTFGAPVFNPATRTWSVTGTLYVNGAPIATQAGLLAPDSLHAPLMENASYLGRGNAGNCFQGYVDDFRVYMKTLSDAEVAAVYATAAPAPITVTPDTTAPTPNAATWLVTPLAISESAATMSATPGTDASGWVEYYFACTSGSGHDSGWVSFNKYTDLGLLPGAASTYTVKMRDKSGNTTAASSPATVTLPTSVAGTAAFAYGPVGMADGQITMTAAKLTNASGKVEYKFDRTSPSAASSGWQSSPTWTQTGLTTGGSYAYTVTVRDGRGNASSPSAPQTALARDDAAPALPIPVAHWQMLPYATIDNKISMTALTASDPSGVQYYFHCVSGGGPDGGWQSGATYVTPALPDGTYVYQYQLRDGSARTNTSAYSTSYPASITPTTGYHTYSLSQVATNPDDFLVRFTATVMRVNSNSYVVKDLASGVSLTVKPSTSNEITSAAYALKNVTVSGHLYTLASAKIVTFASLAVAGSPATTTISGRVTSTAGGTIAGATVYFSDASHPSVSPIVAVTSDASGNYTNAVTPGTWYLAVGASAYNTSLDRIVTVSNASVPGINFSLVPNAKILGQVTRQSDGAALAGASVYFSRSPGASGSPAFTTITDASGNYGQPVQDGIWHVCAGAANSYTSPDKMITVNGTDVAGINFSLKSSVRNIPATDRLLFAAVTDTLPGDGSATGDWATFWPAGQALTALGAPTVQSFSGAKWEKNDRADGDGYRYGGSSGSPIACGGASIVVAVKPVRNATSDAWNSVVDIFYDRLVLGVFNNNGRIHIKRNGSTQTLGANYALPDGQATILSLVVQSNGAYKVWTNGVPIYTNTSTSAMTSLVPGVTGGAGGFGSYINVGRNNPDGWSVFNGYVGDVFVFTNALADTDRQQLETDISAKFLAPVYTITASAWAGGYINPGGVVSVNPGGSQGFAISPLAGYVITNVTVDGVPRGVLTAYTFINLTANHTLSAGFGPAPCTITLTNPLNGDTFFAPARIPLATSVTATRPISRVQFYNGAALLGETTAAPYAWTWTNVAAGLYTLSARVIYDATNSVDSAPINVVVINPPPPVVAITSPAVSNVYIPSGVGLVLEATGSTLRNPPALALAWAKSSGPGTVTFGNPNSPSTTALFSSPGAYGLTLTASDGVLQSSAAVTVGYGVTPPVGWTATSVGTLAAGVGYTTNAGVFNLAASGLGIQSGAAADDFLFVHQAASGDLQITARIVSVQNIAGSSSRAGVTIRETTARGAAEAFMGITSVSGGRFIWRTATDAVSANLTSTLALPYWVRLVRSNNLFSAFTAPDFGSLPGAWTAQGSQAIAMSNAVRIGLAAASGSATATNAAVMDNLTITPPSFNVGPRVSAGPDQAISNALFTLRGAASDDGWPNPPALTTTQWRLTSGPGLVAFSNVLATNTAISFPQPGVYVLRLIATDGEVQTFDDTVITASFLTGPPRISGFVPIAGGGGFGFQVTNATTTNYTVLISTNLVAWSVLPGALRYSSGFFKIADPVTPQPHQRFYRLRHP